MSTNHSSLSSSPQVTRQYLVRLQSGDDQLQQELENYFASEPRRSQNSQLKQLIRLGLAVVTRQYHDQELANLERQVKNLNLTEKTNTEILRKIIEGQADIQDAITGQISDVDAIITPTTQRQANHNQQANS